MMFNMFIQGAPGDSNHPAIWQPDARATFDQSIPANQWFHLGIVYDESSSQATCYLNSDSISTKTFTPGTDTTANIALGSEANANYSFNGFIDDVRIYNGALIQSEIRNITGICYPYYDGFFCCFGSITVTLTRVTPAFL